MCPEPGEEAEAEPIDGTRIPLQISRFPICAVGKAEANPVIRPGDYVLVTEAEPVYITGAVMSPGGIYLRDQLMLSRALAMVGGAQKRSETERCEDISSDRRIRESGSDKRRRCRDQKEPEAGFPASGL